MENAIRERLDGFRALIAGAGNHLVDGWKKSGRGVVGYFCSYVPLELLSAAGLLPLRLRGAGSSDSAAADAYLSSRTCTYVRHALSLALSGHYHFLDGEIGLNTCDHVRRAFDLWRHKTAVAYHGFLSVPRNARESLYPYFQEEVSNLRASLQEHFSAEITTDDLRAAVRLHNLVRERLRRLDAMRAEDVPRLSGADFLTVSVASRVAPPAEFVQMAGDLIAALEAQEPRGPRPRARLLLCGGELDEPGFVDALESQGAAVVADLLCMGMRANLSPVPEDSADPLEAVCRRYFFQTTCARMIGNFPDRFKTLLDAVRARKVDGVVFQRLKFCDPWGAEAHNLRLRLKAEGVPLLLLEREYGLVHAGQVKTRVQAFGELIAAAARKAAAKGGAG